MTSTSDTPVGGAQEPDDQDGPRRQAGGSDGPAGQDEHKLLATPEVEKAEYRWWDLRRVTGGGPTFPLVVLFGLNAVDELDREAFNILVRLSGCPAVLWVPAGL